MNTIEIENVSKSYGKIVALKSINLKVPRGSIYGLVGPNGSGKTTLIKTLIGSLRADTGNVKVLGLDPIKNKNKLRKLIGYMPQASAIYEDLTTRENIMFFGKAQGISNLEKKTDDIISLVELTSKADTKVGTFSGGMKKRVSLCCALINEPKIIFLDEPTAAIDPHLKMVSWKLFRKLAKTGITIVVSTHLMDEVMLCDKVSILNKGEKLIVDTPQNILKRGKTKLNISIKNKNEYAEIDSTPACLAGALKNYGLKEDITEVTIIADNIEDVILNILNKKEQ